RVAWAALVGRGKDLMDADAAPVVVELDQALAPRVHHVKGAVKKIDLVTIVVEPPHQDFRAVKSAVGRASIADNLPSARLTQGRFARHRLEAIDMRAEHSDAEEAAIRDAPPILMVDDVKPFPRRNDIIMAVAFAIAARHACPLAVSTTSNAMLMRSPVTPLG